MKTSAITFYNQLSYTRNRYGNKNSDSSNQQSNVTMSFKGNSGKLIPCILKQQVVPKDVIERAIVESNLREIFGSGSLFALAAYAFSHSQKKDEHGSVEKNNQK